MNTSKLSQKLAKALELTAARSDKLTDDELRLAFDQIEREYLPMMASPELELETRRRVAQWKFRLLSERNLPMSLIEHDYSEVTRLGFSNMENEATILIYFTNYCVRTGRKDVARTGLQQFRGKLAEMLEAADGQATRDLLEAIDMRLDRIL